MLKLFTYTKRARSLVYNSSLHAVAIGSIFVIVVIVPIKIAVLLFYQRNFTIQVFESRTRAASNVVLAWEVASLVICSD